MQKGNDMWTGETELVRKYILGTLVNHSGKQLSGEFVGELAEQLTLAVLEAMVASWPEETMNDGDKDERD